MAKPKHIVLTEDGVITHEALLAYAEARLTESERAEMDKLIKDDPFAQDALEGIRSSTTPAAIQTIVTSLNTQLREKTGVRERKKKGIQIHWANYAYAALVIAVLIGAGFVIIHLLSTNAKEQPATKPTPQAQESIPIPTEIKKEKPNLDSIHIAAIKDSLQRVSKEDSAVKSISDPTSISSPSSPVNSPPAVITPTPPGTETAIQLNVAKTYFEAGDYSNAEKKYKEILASQPGNADALYFGGIASFLNGTNGYGEANFDKLSKSTYYPEGTKWYKANILIKKGNKEDAKQLLRDLINSNGIFRERAVKQYEELFKK